MKRLIATVFVLGLLMPLCFGQATINSANTVISSSNGATFTVDNTGQVIYWTVPNTSWNGIPLERRQRKMGAATLSDLHKTALHITRRDLAPIAYLKLAHDIGVPADEAQILEAIEHNSLEVFDYEKVDSYLYNQALKQNAKMRWVWKPAREKDIDTLKAVGVNSGERENTGFVYEKLYAKRIPMQVMTTIKAVLECAPDAIPLISDFEVAKPDPFLAITTPRLLEEGKIWIVQVWDEPGFGSEPVKQNNPEHHSDQELMAQK